MSTVRIAVVGAGARARDTWLPLLSKIEGYRIAGLTDAAPGRAAAAARAVKVQSQVDRITVSARHHTVWHYGLRPNPSESRLHISRIVRYMCDHGSTVDITNSVHPPLQGTVA
jgi:hypothetical protein